MTVQWHWGGHRREGEAREDPRLHGDGWWRRRGAMLDGNPGSRQRLLQETGGSGEKVSRPCAPPGAERFKVKVKIGI